MKKLLLFILIANLSFAQSSMTNVQILLVNGDVGGMLQSQAPPYLYSSDPYINTILQNNSAIGYQQMGGHPLPQYGNRLIQSNCPTENLNAFLTDLNSYNSVIQNATIMNGNFYNDAANAKLVNGAIGIPIGFDTNNNITTNDLGLNQILATYNVFFYIKLFPSQSNNSELGKYVQMVCNCNVFQLVTALNTYNSVITLAEPVFASLILKTKNFNKINIQIYPNPFTESITIETDLNITEYRIFDVLGKNIVITNLVDKLNSELTKLNSGIYFLELKSNTQESYIKKIIKK
jgi:hypothetical protein